MIKFLSQERRADSYGRETEGEVGRERKQLSLKPPREVAYNLSGSGCNGQKY